jgi:hypothetical protein
LITSVAISLCGLPTPARIDTITTQHPDLIQVVEGFTSPHDRS